MRVPVNPVVNQQPCDAFNPFPSVCHPVCMADESGPGLGMLESRGTLQVSPRPMQTRGALAEYGYPAVPPLFCSKGTKINACDKGAPVPMPISLSAQKNPHH